MGEKSKLTQLLGWIVALLMGVILLVNFTNVILRYFFSAPIFWSDQLGAMLFVWVIFLGAAVGVVSNSHMSIDFFFNKFPPLLKKIVLSFCTLIVIGTLVFLAIEGWKMADIVSHQKYATLPISVMWGFLPIPIGCLFMVVYFISNLIKELKAKE